MSEKVVAFLYEYIGVPMPRGSLYVGMAVLGVIGAAFWLLFWGFAAKSYYTLNPGSVRVAPARDTPEQQQARRELREFFTLHLQPAHGAISGWNNNVAGGLGVAHAALSAMLRNHASTRLDAAWSGIAEAIDNVNSIPFRQLEERFADYYGSYAEVAEFSQMAAVEGAIIYQNLSAYRDWDKVDIEFIEELKRLAADPTLGWLRNRVANQRTRGGDWKVFRLRDGTQ